MCYFCLFLQWCFHWAKQQFTRVALICCMAGHVKNDLSAQNEIDSLLTCIWSKFTVVKSNSTLEGCYCVFDAINGCIRRSGKASPVTISKRWYVDHTKAAKISNSGWYGQFPHKDNPNIRTNKRKGYFDQLQVYVGLAFERSNID